MAFSLDSIDVADVPQDGGYKLRITGTDFLLGGDYQVHIGSNGDATDPLCLSGVPGRATVVRPFSETLLVCYTPVLAESGPLSVFVKQLDPVVTDVLTDSIATVQPRDFKSETYNLRKVLPPYYATGPKSLDGIESVLESEGVIEAITAAFGEELTALGGLYRTRLTSALADATAIVATYNWNGTTTLTTTDTSEVSAGEWIRLNTDNQWFEIDSLVPNTSITILNPNSFTIPTGSTASAKAITSLPVETTLDWPESGKVGVEGVLYTYASKTLSTLDGIAYVKGRIIRPGVGKAHTDEAEVVDLSRERSALDKFRRAVVVEYAEGEDLNVVGRNLGVLRTPLLGDDDIFREVIKAIAYNPRGTFYGIETALDALLGAGNYEVYEDVIASPMTVFIRITGGPFFNEGSSHGKTFMVGPESNVTASGTTINISTTPINRGTVSSVRLKDEGHTTDCRVQFPSADQLEEFPSDPNLTVWSHSGTGVTEGTHTTRIGTVTSLGTVLTWNGTTTVAASSTTGIVVGTFVRLDSDAQWFEVTAVVPNTELTINNPYGWVIPTGSTNSSRTHPVDGATEFTLAPPTDTNSYVHLARVISITDIAEVRAQLTVPTGAPNDTTATTGLILDDGNFFGFVCVQAVTGGFRIGLTNSPAFPSTYVTIPRDQYADVLLRKVKDESWEVWVDGNFVERVSYMSVLPTSGTKSCSFGHYATGAVNKMRVKEASYYARTTRDYWSYHVDGFIALNVLNKDAVNDAFNGFQAIDVGKTLWVLGSTPGIRGGGGGAGEGSNNGVFVIHNFISSSTVEVEGVTYTGAFIQNQSPSLARVQVPTTGQQFKFPDDLGKELVISNSSAVPSNDGAYVITGLLDPDTLNSLESGDTPIPSETNICEVSSGLLTEFDVNYRIDPNFVSEGGLDMVLSDAGSLAGTTITVRNNFPVTGNEGVYDITFSQVLTAQVLQDEDVQNAITQDAPLEFAYYPFYLNDPIGFIKAFIDDLTAAGVIPDTRIE